MATAACQRRCETAETRVLELQADVEASGNECVALKQQLSDERERWNQESEAVVALIKKEHDEATPCVCLHMHTYVRMYARIPHACAHAPHSTHEQHARHAHMHACMHARAACTHSMYASAARTHGWVIHICTHTHIITHAPITARMEHIHDRHMHAHACGASICTHAHMHA